MLSENKVTAIFVKVDAFCKEFDIQIQELKQRVFVVFLLFLKEKCMHKCTGISFMDSSTLKVCCNQLSAPTGFSAALTKGENPLWDGSTASNYICSAMKRESYYLST